MNYKEVVLYSTGCPRCDVLKKKLQQNGVEYTENNDVDKMLGLGIVNVPVLSVDGTLMNFKTACTWLNNGMIMS